MYFKYRDVNGTEELHVMEVRQFAAWPQTYLDERHEAKEGGVILSLDFSTAAMFADDCVSALLGRSDKQAVFENFMTGGNGDLAYFDTFEQAQEVFEDICKALAEGRVFYDLSQHESPKWKRRKLCGNDR